MWAMALNMDSIINLSAMERIGIVPKVGDGYVLMAYPSGTRSSGFVIGRYEKKGDAKSALIGLMGTLKGVKVP